MRRLSIVIVSVASLGCGRVVEDVGAPAAADGDAALPDVAAGPDAAPGPGDGGDVDGEAAALDLDEGSVSWVQRGVGDGKLLHRCEWPSEACSPLESLGFVWAYALSRDGRTLAVAAEREVRHRIDLVVSDGHGNAPATLASDLSSDSFAMSPDGAKLVYVARSADGGWRFRVVTVATGERLDVDAPEPIWPEPLPAPHLSPQAWSHDGRSFAFTTDSAYPPDSRALFVVDTTASPPRIAGAPAILKPAPVAWTADGRVVFVGRSADHATISLMTWDRVGAPVVETPDADVVYRMDVSADGTAIAYSTRADVASGFELYLRSSEPLAKPIRLTPGDLGKDEGPSPARPLAISPDHDKVAFFGRIGGNYGVFVARSKPAPSVSWLSEADDPRESDMLAWSPSSKQLVFFRGGYESRIVRVADVAAKEATPVDALSAAGKGAYGVRWSAAASPADSGVADATTTDADAGAASDAATDAGDATAVSGSAHLWYRMDWKWRDNFDLRVHAVSSASATASASLLGETTEVGALAVSRDGASLVVAAEIEQPMRFDLYGLRRDGTSLVKLHPGSYERAGFRSIAISPDGKRAAYSYLGVGWIAATDGSTRQSFGPAWGPFEWSPDSTKLAYASPDIGELYVVDATATAPTPVPIVPKSWWGPGDAGTSGGASRPRWTSPTALVAPVWRASELGVYRFSLDGAAVDLGFRASSVFDVSRDGSRIVFHDGASVWVAPTDGSAPPTKRVDGEFPNELSDGAPCVFSPDAMKIACVVGLAGSMRGVVVLATTAGAETILYRTHSEIDRLAFAPDGASLAFSTGQEWGSPGSVVRLADVTTPDQEPIFVQPLDFEAKARDLHFVP